MVRELFFVIVGGCNPAHLFVSCVCVCVLEGASMCNGNVKIAWKAFCRGDGFCRSTGGSVCRTSRSIAVATDTAVVIVVQFVVY